MGVVTFEHETPSPFPPAKLFKVFVLDADTLHPKILSDFIKSSEIIEGNGGPGSIRKITSSEGIYTKHKIEALDKENFSYSNTLIEGDAMLGSILEKICYETKFVASPDGAGSIIKSTTKFYPKGNAELNEEKLKDAQEKGWGFFKAIEAYLLANPDA